MWSRSQCNPDYTFPNYNPNTEDLHMLHAMAKAREAAGAEIALGFDADGDRCGVVDDKGEEIFADKVGVLLARDLSTLHPDAKFVVDVKSTGIFEIDPVLKKNGATADYWKTGHSYIKRAYDGAWRARGFREERTLFLPIRQSAAVMTTASWPASRCSKCWIARAGKRCPNSWQACRRPGARRPWRRTAPTTRNMASSMQMTKEYEGLKAKGERILGKTIKDIITVNGVRVTLEDGTWGLVRASSNKPSLVVVVESPVSDAEMHAMFKDLDGRLSKHPEVGEYDQKI